MGWSRWRRPRVDVNRTGPATATSGGIAVSGVAGDITVVHAWPPVRSAYLEQVRRLAPAMLKDRSRELAELGNFCTDPDKGPYLWWRAPAWAGKTAVMSWFVLHPPKRVRVVSFFVTGRYAGQSNRVAFTDVMLEQLAELLGQPMPAYLTDATRDAHLLGLLSEAAQACTEKGERLVLVVDGLDEDRGVITGAEAHSIAALLPAQPVAGMRVVIAGRPNPPVPDDVPKGHPLRNEAIVRTLHPSPHAEVEKADAYRELKRLLHGTPDEQDLLGLVTAAGGGLSSQDLAELTGCPKWQIQEHLRTLSGRTFTRLASRWQPATRPEVYILGHEELQKEAARFLGETRLDGYRQRLHAWSDRYRDQGWPASTPEYLLYGYHRMLEAAGEVTRMVACATDRARHRRMLDVTGGDTPALEEITTTQGAVLDQAEPDLLAMALLALHRGDIVQRNASIPIDLPAAWARLGQLQRAEALVGAMTGNYRQPEAIMAVIEEMVDASDPESAGVMAARAEDLARSITNPERRARALAMVASLASTGDPGRAGGPTRSTRPETKAPKQSWALTQVRRVVATYDPDRAKALPARAKTLARPANRPTVAFWVRPYERIPLVEAVAQTGYLDRAEALAASMSGPDEQARALAIVARAAAEVGDLDRAKALADQAETLACSITEPGEQAGALAAVARVVATTMRNRGEDLAARAENLARSITGPAQQARALTSLIEALADAARAAAEAGDPARAEDLAARTETLARSITDPGEQDLLGLGGGEQAQALVGAARAAAASDPDRAEALARSITDQTSQADALAAVARVVAAADPDRGEALARSITEPYKQAHTLGAVAQVVAAADPDRGEALARSITLPEWQATAMAAVACVMAATGDVGRAETLVAQAEPMARSISSPVIRPWALALVARAAAQAGDLDRAEALARSITDQTWQADALAAVARVVAAADPGRGEALARSITLPEWQAPTLVAVALMVAATGDVGRAEALAAEAQALAYSISDPEEQARALVALAGEARPAYARLLIAQAFRVGTWTTPMRALAEVEPAVLTAVADECLNLALQPG
jgi:hypothetical protein